MGCCWGKDELDACAVSQQQGSARAHTKVPGRRGVWTGYTFPSQLYTAPPVVIKTVTMAQLNERKIMCLTPVPATF